LLGKTMRTIRLAKGLTLKDVAEKSGLSPGFLSRVEQDVVSPSLSSLRKIAIALDTSLFALLASEERCCPVVRRSNRKSFSWPDRNVLFELLTPDHHSSALEVVYTKLLPGEETCDQPLAHGGGRGEEFAYVLRGEIELYVEPRSFHLGRGDSVLFNSSIPHRYKNVGRGTAEFICVMTPPSF